MLTKVTEDEVIRAWLKNEYKKNWTKIRQYLNPNIKDDYFLKLIKNPDYYT